jgi:hypothetical protein
LCSHDEPAQVSVDQLYDLGVDSLEKVLDALKKDSEDIEQENQLGSGSNDEKEDHDETDETKQLATENTYHDDKLSDFVFHPDIEQVPYLTKYLACFCIDINRWKTARERKKREYEVVRGMGYVIVSFFSIHKSMFFTDAYLIQ